MPGFKVSFRRPRRYNAPAEAVSKAQFATFPSASLTSTKTHECGFDRSNFVIVPVTLTFLSRSYSAANEWWAMMGVEANNPPQTANRHSLYFIPVTLPRRQI